MILQRILPIVVGTVKLVADNVSKSGRPKMVTGT
jgi:hypothetical protein